MVDYEKYFSEKWMVKRELIYRTNMIQNMVNICLIGHTRFEEENPLMMLKRG